MTLVRELPPPTIHERVCGPWAPRCRSGAHGAPLAHSACRRESTTARMAGQRRATRIAARLRQDNVAGANVYARGVFRLASPTLWQGAPCRWTNGASEAFRRPAASASSCSCRARTRACPCWPCTRNPARRSRCPVLRTWRRGRSADRCMRLPASKGRRPVRLTASRMVRASGSTTRRAWDSPDPDWLRSAAPARCSSRLGPGSSLKKGRCRARDRDLAGQCSRRP